jgi:hypothetical protein
MPLEDIKMILSLQGDVLLLSAYMLLKFNRCEPTNKVGGKVALTNGETLMVVHDNDCMIEMKEREFLCNRVAVLETIEKYESDHINANECSVRRQVTLRIIPNDYDVRTSLYD